MVSTHRLNEMRVVSQGFLADERGSISPTPVLSGQRLRADELRLGDQRLRAEELSRRGTGFTLTPDMVGPGHPPYYLVKRTMMNLRQKSTDMALGGATRRPLVVQTATAEEREATPSNAGQDDGCGPNPASGSLQFEGIRQERGGISLRRQITAGTWNVQGMTQGKMTVVEREMERCGLTVMGIAEHWWLGQGRFSTAEGSTIMYSGKESGRRSSGVAFMVYNETSRAVLGYNPVSDRGITLRVNAKPVNITFVQVYAPTGASSKEDITAFYEQLQGVLDNVCRKDVIVIMGDWNAKIGKSVHKSVNIGPY